MFKDNLMLKKRKKSVAWDQSVPEVFVRRQKCAASRPKAVTEAFMNPLLPSSLQKSGTRSGPRFRLTVVTASITIDDSYAERHTQRNADCSVVMRRLYATS